MDLDPNIKTEQISNYVEITIWRDFVMEKLDQERTFAGVKIKKNLCNLFTIHL